MRSTWRTWVCRVAVGAACSYLTGGAKIDAQQPTARAVLAAPTSNGQPLPVYESEPPRRLATPTRPVDADDFGLPTQSQLFRVASEPAFRERLQQLLPGVRDVQFPTD